MPTYDRAWFDPPAPLAYVVLRHPDGNAALSDVPMLLDTGADVSLVPSGVLAPLGLTVVSEQRFELAGFDGGTRHVATCRLELVFSRRVFRGRFALIDEPWGILGRNILSAVTLIFDGPNHMWDEFRPGWRGNGR
jgi:hypothetical protein